MGDELRPVRVILADEHALFREAITSASRPGAGMFATKVFHSAG